MHYRCNLSSNPSYERYGGRGISVCKEWDDFETFLKDMGEKPKNGSLDRIDTNGNYCKENCRWADIETQNNNKSDNNLQEYNGKIMSISQWARKFDVPRSSIVTRIYRNKQNFKDALDYVISKRIETGRHGDHHYSRHVFPSFENKETEV